MYFILLIPFVKVAEDGYGKQQTLSFGRNVSASGGSQQCIVFKMKSCTWMMIMMMMALAAFTIASVDMVPLLCGTLHALLAHQRRFLPFPFFAFQAYMVCSDYRMYSALNRMNEQWIWLWLHRKCVRCKTVPLQALNVIAYGRLDDIMWCWLRIGFAFIWQLEEKKSLLRGKYNLHKIASEYW